MDKKEKVVYYSNTQVKSLLDEIKSLIPINSHLLFKVHKFIDEKIENIDRHI